MLLRHAKSNWPAGMADRERPLSERGRETAPAMGAYLADEDLLPDLVLVSPARRTVETWELIAPMLPQRPPHRYEPRIYEAPVRRLLEVVQETEGDVATLMLVGHNPGCEELAALLSAEGEGSALKRMAAKYPTAGLAVIDLAVSDWRDAAPRTGRLARFVTPATLGEGPDT